MKKFSTLAIVAGFATSVAFSASAADLIVPLEAEQVNVTSSTFHVPFFGANGLLGGLAALPLGTIAIIGGVVVVAVQGSTSGT